MILKTGRCRNVKEKKRKGGKRQRHIGKGEAH